MFGSLSGPTLLVILFIVLLLFGAPKLPALARSLGQSMKILKKEVSSDADKSGENEAEKASAEERPAPPADTSADEISRAKAEAAAAKAEAEALRAAAEKKKDDA